MDTRVITRVWAKDDPFGTELAEISLGDGALTARSLALSELQEALELPDAPLPAPLEVTADRRVLAREARLIVLAVASTDIRTRARELGVPAGAIELPLHPEAAPATTMAIAAAGGAGKAQRAGAGTAGPSVAIIPIVLREAPQNLKPVGTGCYMFSEFRPGDHLAGRINPNYHEANKPHFNEFLEAWK